MTKRYDFEVFYDELPSDWQEATFIHCNFHCIDFSGADLSNVRLIGYLYFVDCKFQKDFLKDSSVRSIRFKNCNIEGVDFTKAKIEEYIYFDYCNLQDANFEGLDLSKFNFHKCTNIPQYVYDKTLIVPQEGDVIGWKKCWDGSIVKLLIPDGVPRHNAIRWKCRAERAVVLEIRDRDGKEINEARSTYDVEFYYCLGETVIAENYEPDRWEECAGGIHFFLTREEAEGYGY